MEAIVVLDIGTTGTKAALINRSGKILAGEYAGYDLYAQGREVEQDPADWWQATQSSLRALVKVVPPEARLAAIILSGQMQDVILVGPEDALAPAILYSDARAQEEAAAILVKLGEEKIISTTGNLQDATSLLTKLLWLKRKRPELYEAACKLMIGAHDYVTWKLCGAHMADYTTASTTGLLDLHNNCWAEHLLKALDLRRDWLPELVLSGVQAGCVDTAAAAATGLPEGLPVFHGPGDAATTTLGAGAGEPGRDYVYLGTSGWLAATTNGPPVDPRTGIFNLCHPNPTQLILIGPMITAAGNFEWLRRQFGDLETARPEDAYTRLNELAAQSPAGSNGLLYLPYLSGERAPFRDADARGVFFGLSITSTRQDMYRAVLEGVALSMRMIGDVMFPQGKTAELSLVGGGVRSLLWPQIFANVFRCRVLVLADPGDVGVRGALLAVGKALGWY
ncbi:MAG: FGGY family carbohydrate kinase, partial [Anaerolineaceae bacterium]